MIIKIRKGLLVTGVLSTLLLTGCGKVAPTEEVEVEKVTMTEESTSITSNDNVQTGVVFDKVPEEAEVDLNEQVTIALDGIHHLYEDWDFDRYSDEMLFYLTFINNTDKDIRGFSGTVYFYDIFGDVIHDLSLRYDDEMIPANNSIEWTGVMEVNEFMESNTRLFNTPFENIRFGYDINKVVYMDGTEE